MRRVSIFLGLFSLFFLSFFAPFFSQRAQAQPLTALEYPGPDYFIGLRQLQNGDLEGAAKTFRAAARRGGAQDLDSVCHHAMLGECLFRLGMYAEALRQFDTALIAYLGRKEVTAAFAGIAQFRTVTAKKRPDVPLPPWGISARKSAPADLPTYQQVFRRLVALQPVGQISPDEFARVAVGEILRCATLAVRRKRALLGPLAAEDPTIGRLAMQLTPPRAGNTGVQAAYQHVMIGAVLAAQGKQEQAVTELQSGLLVGNQFDHPLTATALILLANLCLEHGKPDEASSNYRESTFAAAAFGQLELIEEAIVQGAQIARINKEAGLQQTLEAAIAWGHKHCRMVEFSASVDLAELLYANQQFAAATKLMEQLRALQRHAGSGRDPPLGRNGLLAKRFHYVSALLNYQAGNLAGGNAAIAAAVGVEQQTPLLGLRLVVVDSLFASGVISERVAHQVYETLLSEPSTFDWQFDPVNSLYLSTIPMPASAEAWLVAASERKEKAKVLEITERIRNRRFHSLLDMGSRLISIRQILEGAPNVLNEKALLQKTRLLDLYPQYAEMAEQARASRETLKKMIQAEKAPDPKLVNEEAIRLAARSAAQEMAMRTMALRREPFELVFPPQRTAPELQRQIPLGTAIWSFNVIGKNIVSLWIDSERTSLSTVATPQAIRKELADLLKKLGQIDRNYVLDGELGDDGWRPHAQNLMNLLSSGGEIVNWEKYDELVIVPDGILWYLPFELLPAGSTEDAEPLVQRYRVRYAPTVNLALRTERPYVRNPTTALVAGKMSARDTEEFAEWASKQFTESVLDASQLPANAAIPPDLYARLFDRLVVLADLEQSGKGGLDWPPFEDLHGKGNSSLLNWLQCPLGSAETVVLPVFHTAAESGLKHSGNGDELFLTLTGLMASGSRTILLSRWRTSGKTSIELVKEFMLESGHRSASESWQRSVQLAMESRLDVSSEPRIRVKSESGEQAAKHPFFWSGYLLVDTGSPFLTEP